MRGDFLKRRSRKGKCRSVVTPVNAFFIQRVLNWSTIWFDESMERIKSRIIIGDEFRLIPTSSLYDGIGKYSKAWKPLIILEFFHGLMKDLDEDGDIKTKKQSIIKITAPVFVADNPKIIDSRSFTTLTVVKTVILQDENQEVDLFQTGDLVYISDSRFRNNKIFGFVEAVDKKYYKKNRILVFTFHMLIDRFNSIQGRSVIVEKVACLNQYIRMLQALDELPQSPLYQAVMKPNLTDYTMAHGDLTSSLHLLAEKKLNCTQLLTMANITQTVNNREKKICLVQGPPGTGKSTLIINFVEKMVKDFSDLKTNKILICAPSNKAVDGVVLRLMKVQSRVKFNLIRYGRDEKIDPAVKKVSLSYLIHKEFVKRHGRALNMSKARKKEIEFELEEEILDDGEIIASTLTSSYRLSIKNQSIRVCIVDEAGQSTEMATIIPLLLNVSTMILVGDPQQLPPTIISEEAKAKGMGISLFRRAQLIFQEQEETNPIKMLNIQYRMDDSIALWPNKYFYKGLIENQARNFPLNFLHYKILNHDGAQSVDTIDNKQEAKIVMDLLGIVVEEMKMKKIKDCSSVGVITPYRDQKKLISDIVQKKLSSIQSALNAYRKELEKLDDKENENSNKISSKVTSTANVREMKKNIKELQHLVFLWEKMEVNTVDSFQGQERDIIIMSCVRSRGIGFVANPNRLNVSLTRAKHTLILCGNFDTFKKNAMWRNLLADAEDRGVHVNIKKNIDSEKLKSLVIVEEKKEEKKKEKPKKKIFCR